MASVHHIDVDGLGPVTVAIAAGAGVVRCTLTIHGMTKPAALTPTKAQAIGEAFIAAARSAVDPHPLVPR